MSLPGTGTSGNANPYPSNITVSGLAGTVSNVTVSLNGLTHGVSQDLDFLLVSPAGARFVILSDSGNASVTSATIILSDAASNAAPSTVSGPLASGTFRPTNNGANDNFLINQAIWSGPNEPAPAGVATFASSFNGSNPNGTWSLHIFDDAALPTTGIGSLQGWSITITTAVSTQPTSTTLSSSANPAFAGDPITFIATVTSGGNPVAAGTMTFRNGSTIVAGPLNLNGSGQASFVTSALPEGNITVSADYSGATGFGVSNGSLSQTVNNRTVVSGAQFCNPGSIGDLAGSGAGADPANPYPQRVFVSGLGTSLAKVTVTLNSINHQAPSDLDLLLVGPGGQKMLVLSDAGGFAGSGNATITLDDAAASLVPQDSLTSGPFRPANYAPAVGIDAFPAPAPAGPYAEAAPQGSATLLSVFGGTNPNGTWSLFVVDDNATFSGAIGGYCLSFITNSDPATTTTVTSSLNPSFTGNNVTFTATVLSGATPVTTGTVTFLQGNTVLAGPLNLDGTGRASFTTAALAEGSHTITAQFNGASGFAPSSGNIVQTVDSPTVVTGNTFCNNGSLTIAANGPASVYPKRIFVSGLSGVVSKVTLAVGNFSHASPDDVEMLLVSPSGAAFVPWSDVGGFNGVAGVGITLDDAAANSLPDNTAFFSGTFRPTSIQSTATVLPLPAPLGPYPHAAPSGSATFASQFNNTAPNGPWNVFVFDDSLGAAGALNSLCLTITTATADLSITKTHSGNFRQGQTGASYSITVSNAGPAPTAGLVSVVDALPAGLTATSIAGNGWNCVLGTLTCERSDTLAANASYPAITLTVNVGASAPASVTNQATVSGGGDTTSGNNIASDVTTIEPVRTATNVSSLVSTTSTGTLFSFVTRTYNSTVTVRNTSTQPIAGPVHVVFAGLPAGVTVANASGVRPEGPYITISGVPSLAPGASASFQVRFANPSNVRITATTITFSGSF